MAVRLRRSASFWRTAANRLCYTPPMLRAAESFEDMLAAPVGRYFGRGHSLLWCVDPALLGVVIWGRPGHDDVDRLLAAIDRPHHPALAPRCDHLFDARRLRGVDAEVFERYVRALHERRQLIAERVRRHALVGPGGVSGALVAGVSYLLRPPVPWRTFSDLDPALAWLDRSDGRAIADELGRLVTDVADGSPIVGRLRLFLRSAHLRASVDEAARALAMTTRSLQRALRVAGTSYREELERERLQLACELLTGTELKLDVIAMRVGFSSGAHFATFFHARMGRPPSEWRWAAQTKTAGGT
jgi:AraC-like DNA-binding protein